jgi:outer membrane receptor protein involved in Fe transport
MGRPVLYNIAMLSCAAAALAAASQAWAQAPAASPAPAESGGEQSDAPDAERQDPHDIVVTARKQVETVTDVPATINVMSGEDFAARRLGSGLDLNGLVPGFQLYNAVGGAASPTIRGLGSNTAVFSIEASVASFFDGIYAAHPRDLVSPVFDLERVEVIKGTQSTTLGKNTTLGAVSFVSRRPGDDFGFNLTVGHEFKFNGNRVEGGVDIPLSDTLHVRLAGIYSNDGRYIRNRVRNTDEPTREVYGGRVVALWEPTESLKATLIYQHDSYDERGQTVHLITDGTGVGPSVSIRALAAAVGQTDFEVGKGFSYNDYPDRSAYDRQSGDRATLIAEYGLGDFTLTSQTAYVNWDNRRRNDLDFTSASLITFQVDEANELFSQEIRLASPSEKPVSYIVGAYYLWNKWGVDQVIDAEAPWPRTGALNHVYEQAVNSYSGFVQLNASLTDQIKLSAGGRYTEEEKDARYSRTTLRPGSATAIFAPFAERTPSRKENNFDWSLSGQYYLDPRNVIYASLARGSKSGGFQTLPSNPDLAEFEGEEALTSEIGIKTRPTGTLSFDFALYNTTVKDFQYNINTANGNVIANAKVRTRGIDTSLNWRPFDGLRLAGGVVYADAKILEAFPGAPEGTPVQRAPKWTGNVSINYETALSENVDLTINPKIDFSSSQFSQLPSVGAPKRQPYGLVDLVVALGAPDDRWEVALIGKNLTNQKVLLSATTPLLANGPFYGNIQTPATFALQLTVKH